jgi:hypothetical protein
MPSSIRGDSTHLTTTDHDLIRKYLLGAELDSDDLRRVERLYFSDHSVMEQLQLAEDELIEQYIRAELSSDDTRRFREHFLASPRNQERFLFFQQVSRLLEEQNPTKLKRSSVVWKAPAWALLVAGLTLLMIPTVWLLIEARQLGAEIGRLTTLSSKLTAETDGQSAATQELAVQLRREREDIQRLEKGKALVSRPGGHAEGNSSAPAAVSFLLMPVPSETRGETTPEPARHAIPRSAGAVQLDLVLPRGVAVTAYVVSMGTPDGTEVWSSGPLTASSVGGVRLVRTSIPTMVVGNEDYFVNLQAIARNRQLETVETYSFRTLVTR